MSESWFYLSVSKLKWLFCYYTGLIILAVFLILCGLLLKNHKYIELSITESALLGGCGTAIAGCSIFYLRKLYKASINNEIQIPKNEEHELRQLGVFAYYALRPVFAVVFSILLHVLIKASVNIITIKETLLDEGFIYLNMMLSFFTGFAAGDVISYIEEKSKDLVVSTFNKHF